MEKQYRLPLIVLGVSCLLMGLYASLMVGKSSSSIFIVGFASLVNAWVKSQKIRWVLTLLCIALLIIGGIMERSLMQ